MHASLFDRFGGLPAVSRLVLVFYDLVLASRRLKPYFAHADMRRLVEHQAKFIAAVMGGPTAYSDADLREIHSQIGIDQDAFDEMIDLFAQALGEVQISPDEAALIVERLRARQPYIVRPTD